MNIAPSGGEDMCGTSMTALCVRSLCPIFVSDLVKLALKIVEEEGPSMDLVKSLSFTTMIPRLILWCYSYTEPV